MIDSTMGNNIGTLIKVNTKAAPAKVTANKVKSNWDSLFWITVCRKV
jgi:hypothetical protein